MAIRARGNSQSIITPSGSSATLGVDYKSIAGDLTDDRLMDPLVKNKTMNTSYFSLAPEMGQRRVEASIAYNSNEGMVQGLRDSLMQKSQLTLAFSMKDQDPYIARFPRNGDPRNGYGKGYNLTFNVDIAPYTKINWGAGAVPKWNNPNNILSAIQEINLANPSSNVGTRTWTCDPNRRYVIVRRQDVAQCPPDTFASLQNAALRREMEIVRRHLPADQWDVNVSLKCVVPKEGSCYPDEYLNGALVGIQYDQRQECFQGLSTAQYETATKPVKRCAQYVSICLRN